MLRVEYLILLLLVPIIPVFADYHYEELESYSDQRETDVIVFGCSLEECIPKESVPENQIFPLAFYVDNLGPESTYVDIIIEKPSRIQVKYDQERYCNVSATEIRCNAYLSKSSPPTLFTFGMQTTEVSESELFFKVTAETSIVDTNPINNVHTVVGPKKITPYSSSSEDDSTESDDSNLNSSLSIDPNVKYCGPDFTAVLLEELKTSWRHAQNIPEDDTGPFDGVWFLAKNGGLMDIQGENLALDKDGNVIGGCPSNMCSFGNGQFLLTKEICGSCVINHNTNEILFGLMGSAVDAPFAAVVAGAQAHETLNYPGWELEPASARASYSLGYVIDEAFERVDPDLWTVESFCSEIIPTTEWVTITGDSKLQSCPLQPDHCDVSKITTFFSSSYWTLENGFIDPSGNYIENERISKNKISEDPPKVEGEGEFIKRGVPVDIEIEFPDGAKKNFGIIPKSDSFEYNLPITSDSLPGKYHVTVKYDSEIVQQKTIELVSENVPTWVKNNAVWWGQGQIDDQSFVSGIQYLIKNDILLIGSEFAKNAPGIEHEAGVEKGGTFELEDDDYGRPTDPPTRDTNQGTYHTDTNIMIPSWIKTTAQWWGEGQISEDEFLRGIGFLIENEILQVE